MRCRAFSDIVRGLRIDARTLPPAELVRKLNERSGLLNALRAQCKDERSSSAPAQPGRTGRLVRRPEDLGPGELAAQLALLSHADKGDAGNQVR
jgi:ATP-dependent DNA helicase Rep